MIMAANKDWLPKGRTEQLAMADDWIVVCTINQTAWNIPGTVLTELTTLRNTARTALTNAKNETTRTPVANAQCREAFGVLADFMRDMKRRYFLSPPLIDSDFISLGLKPHDGHPTPSSAPTAQVTLETYLVGRHELGVRIIYLTGNPDDKANKGYRIWYSVVAPGETPPANPEELRKSFYTKRKNDLIEFDFGDSGKMVYFAVQVENDGKKGPWGPLVSALIP
jgi:hypothetical protein